MNLPKKKIIFDFGCNNGQNLNYFLHKADIVVAFEANINLVNKIKLEYKKFIENNKLIIENIAVTDNQGIKQINFYISKVNDVLSTLYPEDYDKYYKQIVKCEKASSLIKKYLEYLKFSDIEYIKIDAEGSDQYILKDLLKNNILPKNLSVECHDPEVLELLLKSPYKSFKFMEGEDVPKLKHINFVAHSSGPYGDDIPGGFFDKKSILPYFLNNGLGWKDIHCSLEERENLQTIKYQPDIHAQGLRYHLKKIFPSLLKVLKSKIF